MLVVANFFWGLSFPVIKSILLLHTQLVPTAGPWFSTFYTVAPRFLLATLVLVVWQGRNWWRVTSGELRQGVVIGLFAALGMMFQNDGLQFTAASTSAFLTQFYAIMIPVWLAVRTRRNPGWIIWTCCALVLGGVAILGQFDWRNFRLGRGEIETLEDGSQKPTPPPVIERLNREINAILQLPEVQDAARADGSQITGGSAEHFPAFGLRTGPAAVEDFFATVAREEAFSAFTPREFFADGDKVVVLGDYAMTLRKTGRSFASDWVRVFTFNNGKIAVVTIDPFNFF